MRILYIARNLFPHGAAYSSRVVHFAKMLNDMGHTVHVIADYTMEPGAEDEKIVNLDFCSYQALNSELNVWNRLTVNKKRYNCVKYYLENMHVDYIITSSFPYDYNKMKKLMESKRIPYIVEVCEWYDPSGYKLGKVDFRYMLNQRVLQKKYVKEKKIIAISRYLYEYFETHKVPCIRIPTILDLDEHKFGRDSGNDKVKIMYAGNPGKSKELLGEIFKAIMLLKQEDSHFSDKFRFDIYGVNREQVLLNIQGNKELLDGIQDCIQIQGAIDQRLINKVYREHDFSIFMRPHRRSSDAGFPTKLAESLAAGTPVLANQTGDISFYIHSGENGFVIENEMEKLKEIFSRLVSMDKEIYCRMREAARETAEKNFSYKVYEGQMKLFLQ